MDQLIFLLVLLTIVILTVVIIIALIRRRPVKRKLITMAAIIGGYTVAWLFFRTQATYVDVPMGTDICFDDWCATITKADKLADSSTIVLYATMSNHARGIAQKPDEPRINLIDDKGARYAALTTGRIPLDTRLELHQSLQTTLTFKVPKSAKNIKALIEEGPFITNFLLPVDQQVFTIR